jgi:uncharacterized protein (DUF433 family)
MRSGNPAQMGGAGGTVEVPGLIMGVAEKGGDPLAGGFYTLQDAARLLRIDSDRRVRSWLQGYRGRAEPIVKRDYEPVGGKQSLSFLDLMEIRFLEHFRKQDVPLQTLRRALENARKEMSVRHPFALLPSIKFVTDRRKVFGHAAQETGDTKTWDLVTNQYEMYDAIEEVLAKGVDFDPVSGLAESFRPLPEYQSVIVHPRMAFGRPVVGDRHIPASALFRMWKAESGNKERVAKAFGIKPDDVREAVDFELTLAAA